MNDQHENDSRFRIPERSTRIVIRVLGVILTIYLIVFILSLSSYPLGQRAGVIFNDIDQKLAK